MLSSKVVVILASGICVKKRRLNRFEDVPMSGSSLVGASPLQRIIGKHKLNVRRSLPRVDSREGHIGTG